MNDLRPSIEASQARYAAILFELHHASGPDRNFLYREMATLLTQIMLNGSLFERSLARQEFNEHRWAIKRALKVSLLDRIRKGREPVNAKIPGVYNHVS